MKPRATRTVKARITRIASIVNAFEKACTPGDRVTIGKANAKYLQAQRIFWKLEKKYSGIPKLDHALHTTEAKV